MEKNSKQFERKWVAECLRSGLMIGGVEVEPTIEDVEDELASALFDAAYAAGKQEQYGRWHIEAEGKRKYLTFYLEPGWCIYEIALGNVRTEADRALWLRQVSEKSWCTAQDRSDLVRVLEAECSR